MALDSRFNHITQKIIGAAFRVHGKMGAGFQEVVYQRCLAIELEKEQLIFAREVSMPLYYEGHEVGLRRVDFLVEANVLVELKALAEITNTHFAQIIELIPTSEVLLIFAE